MKQSKGFTLIELLTAMAVVFLVIGWLSQALLNTSKYYTDQLVIKQAYADASVLEMVRRGLDPASIIDLRGVGKSVVLDTPDLATYADYLKTLEAAREASAISEQRAIYNLNVNSVSVTAYVDPEVSDYAYAASNDLGNGAVEIFYREKDPVIMGYVSKPLARKAIVEN